MRYTAPFIILLLITSLCYGADSRTERWKIRLDGLKKTAEANASDARIQSLLIKEAERTEEFISILNRNSSDDGSLRSAEKKYSVHEIEKRTAEISEPLIAICIFSELVKKLRNPPALHELSQKIDIYIKNIPHDGSFRADKRELLNMSTEYFFEKVIKRYAEAYGLKYTIFRYFNACGATEQSKEQHAQESHLIPLIK